MDAMTLPSESVHSTKPLTGDARGTLRAPSVQVLDACALPATQRRSPFGEFATATTASFSGL
jgi:hypothetical protein